MTDWRLARSLVTLFAEINAAHPNRPKAADGSIGDARHQAEVSDHNPRVDARDPNGPGVVTAIDITTDLPWTVDLAEDLRLMGKHGDGRVKYVIYQGRIASSRDGWAWRTYVGFSQHFDHIHLSVSSDPAQYDRTDPWQPQQAAHDTTPPQPLPEDEVTPEDRKAIVADVVQVLLHGGPGGTALVATHGDMVTLLHGTKDGSHPNNLDNIGKAVGVKQ